MKDIFVKIRGADIKEIEIFMTLVTVWVAILLGTAYWYPTVSMDSIVVTLLLKYPYISCFIFWAASFISLLGIITYLGKYLNFITSWLFISGLFWGGISFLLLFLQPFSLIFGVCAFLTTTSFHLYTLQVKERVPIVLCRKHPELCKEKNFRRKVE